jgi:transposase InsO family protein
MTLPRPYAGDDYRAALAQRGIFASMSGKGDCYDNAVAESFFATLKAEHLDHETFPSREVARASIAEYIEGFYNAAWRHSSTAASVPSSLNCDPTSPRWAQSHCPRRRRKIRRPDTLLAYLCA